MQHYNIPEREIAASVMLEDIRPGERATAQAGRSSGRHGGLGLRVEPIDRQVFRERRRRGGALAVLCALLLHATVGVALIAVRDEPAGGGGTDLEAVSVDVEIVSASALESRAIRASEAAASAASVDRTEGSPGVSAATPEAAAQPPTPTEQTVSQEPAETPAETEPRNTKPDTPADDAPPEPLPRLALMDPDRLPIDPDAITLPAREPETPAKPADVERDKQPAPAPAEAAAPSANTGGATSYATDGLHRHAQAAAVATPERVRAFIKAVVAALQETRPRRLNARARGTTRVVFAIAESGGLEFVRLAKSSGSSMLDETAIAAVRRSTFPAPPPGMTLAQRTYEVPYRFR